MPNRLSTEDAKTRIYVLDSKGVIYDEKKGLDAYKREFSRKPGFAADWNLRDPQQVDLLDLVNNIPISVLIGLSGVGGSFSEEMIRRMASNTERPVIFPLSNPTANTEALPEDIYRWTEGKAIVATGSPFPDVTVGSRTLTVGQGNNVFIFPGVGLGALAVDARIISDDMITAAARRLSEIVPSRYLDRNCVYPDPAQLREVCREVAVAVARSAIEHGVAGDPVEQDHLEERVTSRMWTPKYARYTRGVEKD